MKVYVLDIAAFIDAIYWLDTKLMYTSLIPIEIIKSFNLKSNINLPIFLMKKNTLLVSIFLFVNQTMPAILCPFWNVSLDSID